MVVFFFKQKTAYEMILVARNETLLKEVAARLGPKHQVRTAIVALDLGAQGAGRKLANAIAAQGLSVDVLVNNAGYGTAGAFDGSDEAGQLGMIDLNGRALTELTHISLPVIV